MPGRQRNGLTLQDLSARCIQVDAAVPPSISCLSMIETGQRILLEPGFLFSRELLEAASPELLAQTGTTGRQFAHLLSRSHQEMARNDFPDLERSAEEVGERRLPLSVDDLMRLCKRHGVETHSFDRKPLLARDNDREVRSVVRSFFAPQVRSRIAPGPQGAPRRRDGRQEILDQMQEGIASRKSASPAVRGVTDNRLPRRRICIPASSGCWRSASRASGDRSRLLNRTSIASQVGVSCRLLGSKYSDVRSNWVGSGYAGPATVMVPTMPGWSQLEW